MDNILLISILLIFLTALFSNVIKQRKRDRVLKDMHNFHITLELNKGKRVWGKARIYSNGMEFIFSDPHKSSNGDFTTSYIIHQHDLDHIWVFFRFHNELSTENQLRRQQEVKNTIQPKIFNRFKRVSRNLINAFNDAINEALGVLLNRLKGHGSLVVQQQDQYLKKIGASALGLVGNVFNPILEHYINHRVVIEVINGEKEEAFCGFLKEYSPSWMSLLDCQIKQKDSLCIADIERMSLQRHIDMEIMMTEEGGKITLDFLISYFGVHKLKLIAIQSENSNKQYFHKIDQTINSHGSISLSVEDLPADFTEKIDIHHLPIKFTMIAPERRESDAPIENEVYQELLPELELVFYTERLADVYIPRSLGTLRKGADFMDED